MLEGFVQIKKQKTKAKALPIMRIDKFNNISFNKICAEILAKTESYCTLWFDAKNKRIALLPSSDSIDGKRISKITNFNYTSKYIKNKTEEMLKNTWVRNRENSNKKIYTVGKYYEEHNAIIFNITDKADSSVI